MCSNPSHGENEDVILNWKSCIFFPLRQSSKHRNQCSFVEHRKENVWRRLVFPQEFKFWEWRRRKHDAVSLIIINYYTAV